jgi:hypothetical protein
VGVRIQQGRAWMERLQAFLTLKASSAMLAPAEPLQLGTGPAAALMLLGKGPLTLNQKPAECSKRTNAAGLVETCLVGVRVQQGRAWMERLQAFLCRKASSAMLASAEPLQLSTGPAAALMLLSTGPLTVGKRQGGCSRVQMQFHRLRHMECWSSKGVHGWRASRPAKLEGFFSHARPC